MCWLCWFVNLICSLIIDGIVCLVVRPIRFSVVLFCYLFLGFDVIDLMFGGWVCSFDVGENVVLGI